jgi:hypothetical protein
VQSTVGAPVRLTIGPVLIRIGVSNAKVHRSQDMYNGAGREYSREGTASQRTAAMTMSSTSGAALLAAAMERNSTDSIEPRPNTPLR